MTTSEVATTPSGETSETTAPTGITKLFIGSLSFKTGKPSLTKAFTDLEIAVKTAKVVRNITGRSMGYGFVEVEDKDADKAVEKLHHTELDGRQINVEKATSTKPKRKSSPVKRPNTNNKKAEEGEAPKEKPTKPAAPKKEPKARTPKPRAPRAPRPTPVPRESSETKLYVANIPFSLTDEDLAKHFADVGKVVGKVIVNKKTGRSRGYGFVEVENAEQQTKALEKNKSQIDGRAITVRAAYRELPVPEPSTETGNTEAKEEKKENTPKSPIKKGAQKAVAAPKKEASPAEVKKEDKPAETKTEAPKEDIPAEKSSA